MSTPHITKARESIFPEGKEQDEILESYIKMLGKNDAGKLHQFFSPTRIPRGLSEKQAKICVRLLPMRKRHTDRKLKKKPRLTRILDRRGLESGNDFQDNPNPNFSLNTLVSTMQLPKELVCNGSPISKFKFYLGIAKLLCQAALRK